ncbi:MAG: hypothetical protein DRG78_15495 [Epsilonproteobacteria bacterium]|nr:MAG: hypothetical protein DRG78_15495 [Campylobacterota bacterium]
MLTIEIITEFLGWCSVINIVILALSAIFIIVFNDTTIKIHSKLFNLDKIYLQQSYFKYLAQYKIIIIIFNIVPYFALKIIG